MRSILCRRLPTIFARRSSVAVATLSPPGSPAGHWSTTSGMLQTIGGVAATATDDPVGQWGDQSGNGLILTQSDGIRRPTLQLNQINGYPAIRFNGSNSRLFRSFSFAPPFQVFLVVKQISWGDGDIIIGSNDFGNWGIRMNGSSPRVRQENASNNTSDVSGMTIGSWGIIEGNMPNSGGGNHSIRVNQGTASFGGVNDNTSRGGISVGAGQAGNVAANIDLAEIIVYSSILTGTDLTDVYTYISSKYGLS